MARLPDEFIAQLKSANNIVDMFRTYADVKKRGRLYICCCPFHAEKTPSCTIYPESSSFYCFGCHVGGDIVKFIMLMDNVSYMEAVRILAQRSGLTVPSLNSEQKQKSALRDRCYEINREAANFYFQNLLKSSDKLGLQFLKVHQIQPQTVKQYALGYASNDWQSLYYHLRQKGYSDHEILASELCRQNQNQKLYDYFRNRIIFPVVDFRGSVIAFGAKAIDGSQPELLYTNTTPVSDRNKIVFSLNFAKNSVNANLLILAENYFNAVILHQAGFENVVAVPDRLTIHQAKSIARYAKQIILISSHAVHYGDMQSVRNLFSEAEISVRILSLPDHLDSAEFIRNQGVETFRNLLDHAGDAIQTALQNSWNGLDEDQDRTALIQNSAAVLAKINNPLEREVYLIQTAKKFHLTPEQMQSQIDSLTHKKNTFYANASRSLQKEELSAQNPHHLKKRRAEEQILIYLTRFPEEIPNIQQNLPSALFMTEAYQNCYQMICQYNGNLPEFPSELTELIRKYQEFDFTRESTDDCINVLKSGQVIP